MSTARCTIIIVAFNHASDLPACLDNLLIQDYPDFEIILVDNASQDGTSIIATRYASRVRYLRLPINRGFAAGNNAGAKIAMGTILVFLNPDTVPEPGWLSALVNPFSQNDHVGLTTSRILLAQSPHLINTCGNNITWTGLTVCRGQGQRASEWQTDSEVSAVSGAAFAIRRSLFDSLGGFDENFFIYFEDTDLSLRAQLAGYRVWFVADSLVAHKYTFKFSSQKAYYQERNRWLAMFKVLSTPTLILLLPMLAFGEVVAWMYAALHGLTHLQAKLYGWQWLWSNRKTVLALRRITQAQRRVSDRELLRLWSAQLRFAGTVPTKLAQLLERLTQPILQSYGILCRHLLIWSEHKVKSD